ncbi:MAG: leucine-rich repeat domain-containing protein [Bacilli bacterium]|nr:leucine-rich repeat domain-containing protein [Bacilli bacterium]
MKKNKLLTLSIAALLGFGTVAGLGIKASFKKTTVIANTTLTESVEDKNGAGLTFPNHVRREGEPVRTSVHNKLGVRLLDADEGKKSVQFIAALTGYSDLASATWTRTVTDYKGNTIKASSDIAVKNVYTALADPESVVWDVALKADTTYYYMVYTLNNIPATDVFSTIDVSFKASYTDGTSTTAVSKKANVKGFEGAIEKPTNVTIKVGLKATETSDAKYFAGKTGSDSTTEEVTIPEDYYTVDGVQAKDPGKVTALANGTVSDTNGAFENWSKLKKVNMPATITAFDKYCFTGTALEEVEFPRDLTEIQDYAFGWASGLATFKTVYYNAKNLKTVTSNGCIGNKIDTVYVSAAVESIPNVVIFKGGVEKVVYEGTEAQWETLMGTANVTGLNIDNVICSDTVTYAVTYNLEGGNINGSTDPYVVNIKSGKNAPAVTPRKDGQKFLGWFDAAEGGSLVNLEAVSAPIVAYAHWGEFPAGSTKEKAVVLTEGYTGTHGCEAGMESVWAKFTAEEAGRYYIDQSNVQYTGSNGAGTHAVSAQSKIRVFNEDGTEVSYSTPSSSVSTYAKVAGKCASTYGRVFIDFEAGETYYFQMYVYYSTSYPTEAAYGTFDVKFGKASFTNDTPETATVINPETGDVDVSYVLGDWDQEQRFYKFTATKDAEYFFTATSEGSTWAGVYVKEADEDGSFKYDSNKLAYSYGTGSMSGAANIKVTTGKTYYVITTVNGVNNNHVDTKKVGFRLAEPPAGSTDSKPVSGVLKADGTPIEITSAIGAGTYNYYKVTVATDGEYKLSISIPDHGYNCLKAFIYKADGTLVKEGNTGNSYVKSIVLDENLEAGEYTVKIGWKETNWPGSKTITASMWQVLPGSEMSNALEDLTDTDPLSTNITTTLANEYHKFVASETAGYYFSLGEGEDVTSYDVVDSTGASLVNVAAGQSERYAALESGKTYYVVFHGVGTATFGCHHGAIKPDGTTRAKAYDWEFDSTGKQAMLADLPSKDTTKVWYKKTFTEAELGTYRFYSANDSTVDTKINGIYKDDATSSITGTYNDDDSLKHPGFTVYKYDFYIEFNVTEVGTYYFDMKCITKTSSGVSSATYLDYHLEAISLLNPPATDPEPEQPQDPDPDAPAYAGTFVNEDGDVLVINNDGVTGSINGVLIGFEGPNATGLFTVNSAYYNGSEFTYDAVNDRIVDGYFLDQGEYATQYAEGTFVRQTSGSSEDTPTPSTGAYVGYTYGGKVGLNNATCEFDDDGLHVTWNGVTVEYTVSPTGHVLFAVGPISYDLTYNSNDSFSVHSEDDDYNQWDGTLSATN